MIYVWIIMSLLIAFNSFVRGMRLYDETRWSLLYFLEGLVWLMVIYYSIDNIHT